MVQGQNGERQSIFLWRGDALEDNGGYEFEKVVNLLPETRSALYKIGFTELMPRDALCSQTRHGQADGGMDGRGSGQAHGRSEPHNPSSRLRPGHRLTEQWKRSYNLLVPRHLLQPNDLGHQGDRAVHARNAHTAGL